MIVQACLNGARVAGYHPALPLTPTALASDAAACVRAGAAEIHLHIRDAGGGESLDPKAADAVLGAVRTAVPGIPVGVSTGAWIERDTLRTLACIDAWRALPDYASVNLSEPDADAVMSRLIARRIGIEAGIATNEDAETLAKSGLGDACLRMLVEVRATITKAAIAETDAILATLRRAGISRPVLLHGFDEQVWPLISEAALRGLSTRVGFEDGDRLPDGTIALTNSALVAEAVRVLHGAKAADRKNPPLLPPALS